jgi:hypothetical protein
MNKLLAAGLGLALIAAPLAASAREAPRAEVAHIQVDYRHGGGYGYDHNRGYDHHRGYEGRGHYGRRCFIRNEPVRGRHGRIFYRQVEVCRR